MIINIIFITKNRKKSQIIRRKNVKFYYKIRDFA